MYKCPYCGVEPRLVTAEHIYGPGDESWKKGRIFWECPFCLASVGCHPGTTKPLGNLADSEMRKLRMEVHRLFDPIWREGSKTRNEAYLWLANSLGINYKVCHISMLSLKQLEIAKELCENFHE